MYIKHKNELVIKINIDTAFFLEMTSFFRQ